VKDEDSQLEAASSCHSSSYYACSYQPSCNFLPPQTTKTKGTRRKTENGNKLQPPQVEGQAEVMEETHLLLSVFCFVLKEQERAKN